MVQTAHRSDSALPRSKLSLIETQISELIGNYDTVGVQIAALEDSKGIQEWKPDNTAHRVFIRTKHKIIDIAWKDPNTSPDVDPFTPESVGLWSFPFHYKGHVQHHKSDVNDISIHYIADDSRGTIKVQGGRGFMLLTNATPAQAKADVFLEGMGGHREVFSWV